MKFVPARKISKAITLLEDAQRDLQKQKPVGVGLGKEITRLVEIRVELFNIRASVMARAALKLAGGDGV